MSSAPPPPEPTTSVITPSADYGGYALRSVREAGGEETLCFEATLTRHGRPIAVVSNGGTGGSHRYSPLERGGRDDIEAFRQFAVRWNAGSELAGYADDDQLIDRLVEVARLNRSRRLLFLLDDADYWSTGEARAVVGIPDRADALDYLRHQYVGRTVRVWNRNVSDWVLLDT